MSEDRRSIVDLRTELEEEFKRRGIEFRPATESWHSPRQNWSPTELQLNSAYWLRTSPTQMKTVIAAMTTDRRHETFQELEEWLNNIEKLKTDDSELRKFIKLMQHDDTTEIEHEAHVAAMKQWIWQVKRNVAHMDVTWQVMLIFWSKVQGSGKSRAVDRVCGALTRFIRHVGVDELNERFSARMFANAFIVIFDELAGVGKADAAALKALLTGKRFDRRTMHSEAGFSAENRLSCIATTNERPPHGFNPDIGERRLWSIHCREQPYEEGSARAEALDMLRLERIWAAVSIDDPAPHETLPKPLKKFMEEQRKRNMVQVNVMEEFCGEHLIPCESEYRQPVDEIRRALKSYCQRCDMPPIKGSYSTFCRMLGDLNIPTVSPKRTYYVAGYRLSDEAMKDV